MDPEPGHDLFKIYDRLQTEHSRELWPDWLFRDPALVEQLVDGDGAFVPGCYHTEPAPTPE